MINNRKNKTWFFKQLEISKLKEEINNEIKNKKITYRQLYVENQILLSDQHFCKTNYAVWFRLWQKNKILNSLIENKTKTIKKRNFKTMTSSVENILNFRTFSFVFKDYARRQLWKDAFWLWIGSFIIVFTYDYFIFSTGANGIFPVGLSAICRELSLIIGDKQLDVRESFYLTYIVFNIPFFIFGFWKLGLRFSLLSFTGICFQNIDNIIILNIPIVNPDKLFFIINLKELLKQQPLASLIWFFIFGFIGGFMCGFGYACIYKSGGSTAGLDFVSGFFQKKYKISIASINLVINISLVIIVIFIHSIIMSGSELNTFFGTTKADANIWSYRVLYTIGPTLFASFIFLYIQKVITNKIYPRFSFVILKIYTEKPQHIMEALRYKGIKEIIHFYKLNNKNTNYQKDISCLSFSTSAINIRTIKSLTAVIDKKAIFEIGSPIKRKNIFK